MAICAKCKFLSYCNYYAVYTCTYSEHKVLNHITGKFVALGGVRCETKNDKFENGCEDFQGGGKLNFIKKYFR